MTTTQPTAAIDLADAIEAVRNQLVEAAARGADAEIAFEVGEIELEFTVELKQDVRGSGGIRAWVFSGDVEAGAERGRTQRVAVRLTPRKRSDGGRVDVGDDAPANLAGF